MFEENMSKKRHCVFATITLDLSKAGIHAMCNDIDEDVFCVDGDIQPLIELINKAEKLNPKYREGKNKEE